MRAVDRLPSRRLWKGKVFTANLTCAFCVRDIGDVSKFPPDRKPSENGQSMALCYSSLFPPNFKRLASSAIAAPEDGRAPVLKTKKARTTFAIRALNFLVIRL